MIVPDIHKGKYIFHFTDLRNLDSIIKNGLLCTNEKNKQGIQHHNIANESIQERRAKMDVTAGPGGKVHDYVPFYFSSINPMLLTLLNQKNCDQNLIIYLCVKIDRLDKDDAVFTNASANTAEPPAFYDSLKHLDDLDWNLIYSRKWKMESDEDKHKKMAEALIRRRVDIREVDAVVVYNENIKKLVTKIFAKNDVTPPEILYDWNSKMRKNGFYYTKFFFKDRKHETLVTGPCSLLHNYKRLIDEVKEKRKAKKDNYPYETVKDLVNALYKDFTRLPELKAVTGLLQDYSPHNDTVDAHTRKVVEQMAEQAYYKKASEAVKYVLLLGAYLHDIGKGPKSKWKDEKMTTSYPDHPVDAIPMLRRILIEEIETLSDDEIRRLCMLVVYHDILGECIGKGRDKQQIANLIDSEDDLDMLIAIGLADSIAINSFWRERLISDADCIKTTIMKMKHIP